jgi:hypothetical protein
MAESKFKPGDRATRTGVYVVTHRSHRLSHLALLEEGETFPRCAKCGADARFALHIRAQHIEGDRDFRRNNAKILPMRVSLA